MRVGEGHESLHHGLFSVHSLKDGPPAISGKAAAGVLVKVLRT